MISMNTRTSHARTVEPATGTGRDAETRACAGTAPVRVVPLWKAPCALAPQASTTR
ncbi:hypothetical protein [Kitasatospora sp. NPDC057015]|uniref:hypothetical protein n=1 Tax=Kitasatospora sp. NPDC057015 TaxID=3346001 RepID=UPI003628442E